MPNRDSVTVPSSEPLVIRMNEGGETVDEIVAKNCNFHIEQMSATGFWFCVNDSHFHIGSRNGRSHIDLTITDLDDKSVPSSDPEGGARGEKAVQGSIADGQHCNEQSGKQLSPAWPAGCHSPNSCDRHQRCMYVNCKFENTDIREAIATAQLTKTPSADHDAGNLRGLAEPNHQPHAVSQGWRDIETAPRDGTRILIWFVHANAKYSSDPIAEGWEAAHEAYWIDHNGGGWTWHGLCGVATYWMPLPAPPSPAKTGGAS